MLFENDHVIVWEQVGFPEEPFVHKHVRDVLGFVVEPGAMEVLGPDLERTPKLELSLVGVRPYE